MATEVFMPKAGMDMQEGTIIKWLKKVGEQVAEGDGLLEIETDKVTMEVESPATGVLLCTYFEDGAVVPVVTTIGYVGRVGETVPSGPSLAGAPTDDGEKQTEALPLPTRTQKKEGGIAATPYAKKLAKDAGLSLSQVLPSGEMGEVKGRDVEAKINATPLAKRIAQDKQIDLQDILGSGHEGKITKTDLTAVVTPQAQSKEERRTKLSGMRKVVSSRMSKAHAEIPSATIHIKADVTDLVAFRLVLNKEREKGFSLNDFVLKAVAKALTQHKQLLMSLDGDEIIHHHSIHIGMAVGLEDGLIVPVIKDADKMGLEAIAAKAKDLAARARIGKLDMEEYKGSTFSMTNMGMFGIDSFTPIINLPDSMILGVCAIEDVLALVAGEVIVRKKMGLSLTFDHRLLDGVPTAKFLNTLKNLLEKPMEILL